MQAPAVPQPPREPVPTQRQFALWKAVQNAKLQGLVPACDRPRIGHSPKHRATLRTNTDSAGQSPSNRAGEITAEISHSIRRLTFSLATSH